MIQAFLSLALMINFGVHGNIYGIAERDIVEEMKEKAGKIVPEEQETMKEAVRKSYVIDNQLPEAKEKRKRYKEFIRVASEDIEVEGRKIASKGEKVNLMEKVPLGQKFLFIKSHHLPMFLKMSEKDRGLVACVIQGDLLELNNRYADRTFYSCGKFVSELLGVERVPTLVYQKGNKMVIEELPFVNNP